MPAQAGGRGAEQLLPVAPGGLVLHQSLPHHQQVLELPEDRARQRRRGGLEAGAEALEDGGVHRVGLLQPAQAAGKIPGLPGVEHGERHLRLCGGHLQRLMVAAGGLTDQVRGGVDAAQLQQPAGQHGGFIGDIGGGGTAEGEGVLGDIDADVVGCDRGHTLPC